MYFEVGDPNISCYVEGRSLLFSLQSLAALNMQSKFIWLPHFIWLNARDLFSKCKSWIVCRWGWMVNPCKLCIILKYTCNAVWSLPCYSFCFTLFCYVKSNFKSLSYLYSWLNDVLFLSQPFRQNNTSNKTICKTSLEEPKGLYCESITVNHEANGSQYTVIIWVEVLVYVCVYLFI